ncbi:calsyntenin-1 [Trichonephila clavipes]|uniref:Calsyntenin-1 n=1 Tax=Trichonephila clavipes TaxID=2585209 RepID=A0A8X6V268_TRICX|nr:calsyntenin-1 [Trichonephila clavipes]
MIKVYVKSLKFLLNLSLSPRRIRRKHLFGDGSKDVQLSYEDDLRRIMFSSEDRVTAEIRKIPTVAESSAKICFFKACSDIEHGRTYIKLLKTVIKNSLPNLSARGCGSPVVKVSDHGRHVRSSCPVPLKTRRVGQRCTLNLSRAETSSHWQVDDLTLRPCYRVTGIGWGEEYLPAWDDRCFRDFELSASSDSIDLLPSPGIGAEWTRGLPTDDGHESDQIYEFDGTSNAVVIPESTLNHNLTDNFTVAFWMKHEPYPDHNDTHMKEHIICNADDHKMNRHHYSIFVRNCRLILLLRREFYQERPSVFRPAEWRWKMPEVCDNQWHHYAVSVNFPEATLYVDGQQFKIQTNNPDIVDDWPLHPAKDINTTFVVGACWQGKDEKMAFNFHGFLAGLSVLRGRTENSEVLACLHRCKEGLEVPPADLLEPGMELLTNSDLSEVTVEGNSKSNLEDLISRVGYVNSREFPTPGRRSVQIGTTVTCAKGKTVKVPPVEAYIMVLQPELPSITINGTPNLAREYEAFKQGIQLFASVSVLISQDEEVHSNGLESMDHKLDSCSVQVYPPLNPDHEYFKLPISLMTHLGIHHKENKDGLVIFGADTIHNYDLILRQIVYYNRKPAYYLNRAFKLVCSELNGRFVSNEYIQTLTVIHPRAEPGHEAEPKPALEPVNHAQVHDHKVEFKEAKVRAAEFMDNDLGGGSEAIAKTSASHAVAIIIVVCVGFLVFMIVLGVIRIRAAHHRSRETRDEDQELAWDDDSLTIIVNPMDQIEQEQVTRPLNEEEDSDSSDDGSSYRDDGESSEEEEDAGAAGKAKTKELEWDDSTLNF